MTASPSRGGKAENYSLEIGSGEFIPGFEDQMVGMAPESEGEVNVTFPEQYQPWSWLARTPPLRSRFTLCVSRSCPSSTTSSPRTSASLTPSRSTGRPEAKLYDGRVENATDKFHSELLTEACDNMNVTVPESMMSETGTSSWSTTPMNLGAAGPTVPSSFRASA